MLPSRSAHGPTLGLLLFASLLTAPPVVADEHSAPDEDALVERVTDQVIERLRESGVLEDAIVEGIERYIAEQRAAQARARTAEQQAAAERARAVRPATSERDHIRGNPEAEVSLIEYSDFECPFCKRFHATAQAAVEAYGGRVNWVYRHFPLAFHNPLAQKEAEASECAASVGGNEGFWRYTDAVYERTTSNGDGFPLEALVPLAGEVGLDVDEFRECFESERHRDRVLADFEEGRSIGITGTPGNVLRDNRGGEVRVISGAVPLPELRAAIDSMLGDD